jgi:hypothetical protein
VDSPGGMIGNKPDRQGSFYKKLLQPKDYQSDYLKLHDHP